MPRKPKKDKQPEQPVHVNPDTLPEVEAPRAVVPLFQVEVSNHDDIVRGIGQALELSNDGEEGLVKIATLHQGAKFLHQQGKKIKALLGEVAVAVHSAQLWRLYEHFGADQGYRSEADFWGDIGIEYREVQELLVFHSDLKPVLEKAGIDADKFWEETSREGLNAARREAQDISRQLPKKGNITDETKQEIQERPLAFQGASPTEVKAMQRMQKNEPEPTPLDFQLVMLPVNGEIQLSMRAQLTMDEARAWKDRQFYFRFWLNDERVDALTAWEVIQKKQEELDDDQDVTVFRARVVDSTASVDDLAAGLDFGEEEPVIRPIKKSIPLGNQRVA